MSLVKLVQNIEVAISNDEKVVEKFVVEIEGIASGKPSPTGNAKADKVVNLVTALVAIYGDVNKVLALGEVQALLAAIEAL